MGVFIVMRANTLTNDEEWGINGVNNVDDFSQKAADIRNGQGGTDRARCA